MKVKRSTKKVPATHPDVAAALERLAPTFPKSTTADTTTTTTTTTTTDDPSADASTSTSLPPPRPVHTEVTQALRNEFPPNSPWRYPRGDLHAWIPLLDNLDDVLLGVIDAHGLQDATNVEKGEWTKDDEECVLEILRVERGLLDNSTSRKIFASYDRMQALLASSSLRIIHATLLLLLRPAVQYNTATPFELSMNQTIRKRLLRLVQSGGQWGRIKDVGWDLCKLAKYASASPGTESSVHPPAEIPDAWFEVQESFYRNLGDSNVKPSTVELERPTSELRLQTPQAGTPSRLLGVPSGDSSMLETPSRPSVPSRLSQQLDSTIDPMSRNATPTQETSHTQSLALAHMDEENPGPSTPRAVTSHASTRVYTSSEGLTTVLVPSHTILSALKDGRTPIELVRELIEAHPELQDKSVHEEMLEIFQKLRLVMMVGKNDKEEMALMVQIRLLAMATYIHVTVEDTAQSELFLFEPTLISQVAELAQPSAKIDDKTLAATLTALDACVRYRGRTSEVMSALNVNLPHGNLLTLVRDVVTRLQQGKEVASDLVDSVLSFLSFAVTAQTFGTMLVGAGIIGILLEIIKITDPAKGAYVARAAGLLDSVIYSNTNAFTLFCNVNGLEIFNNRITGELDRLSGDKVAATESELQLNTQPLRLLLRSVYRMMQATGTADGLRNLIDSPLPKNLLRILQNPKMVGPSIVALAINVSATFVHNEPTSLSTIQELKLPNAAYDAFLSTEKPSFELLTATSNAVSAFCLNATGLDYTVNRPEIIVRLVHSPLDASLRDMLRDRDNAAFLGSTMDELTRHHPALKQIVLDSIMSLLKEIKARGETGRCKNVTAAGEYHLLAEDKTPETSPEWVETEIDIILDNATEIMQGLFQNPSIIKDFLDMGGLDAIFDLYDMPALVNYFAETQTAAFLNATVRVMAEGDMDKVLRSVVTRASEAIDACSPKWQQEFQKDGSYLNQMLSPSHSAFKQANADYRQLVYLNNMLGLLSNIFATTGFAHGKLATQLINAFRAKDGDDVLLKLGNIHRLCLWETCCLEPKLKTLKKDDTQIEDKKLEEKNPGTIERADQMAEGHLSSAAEEDQSAMEIDAAAPEPTAETAPEPSTEATLTTAEGSTESKPAAVPASSNAKAIKAILRQMPSSVLQVLQGVSKLLLFRKADAAHKLVALPTAAQIAQIMVDHVKEDIRVSDRRGKAFRTTLLTVVWILLLDERNGSGSLQTMLLVQFQRKGGLDSLKELAEAAMKDVADTQNPKNDDDKAAWETSMAQLKVITDLIRVLILQKTVLDSNQSHMLAGREKDRSSPDFFSPHELLITLRLTFFDTIVSMWNAPWLPKATLPVVQAVVQAVLALLSTVPKPVEPTLPNGANGIGAIVAPSAANPPVAPVVRQPTVPNEGHLEMLTSMGFTRHASTVALTRLNNNLEASAEYLLAHAHLIADPPAEAAPAPAPAAPAAPEASEALEAPASAAIDEQVPDVAPGQAEEGNAPEASAPVIDQEAPTAPAADVEMKTESVAPDVPSVPARSEEEVEQDRKKLEELVREVRPSLLPTALALLDTFDGLVFDLSVVFSDTENGISSVVSSLIASIENTDEEDRDKTLSSRLRLMAVISHQPSFREKVTEEQLTKLMSALVKLPVNIETRPRWLSGLLLSIESLLIWSDGIKSIEIDTEAELTLVGPDYSDARQSTLQLVINVLQAKDLNQEEAVAALRVLVVLTRRDEAKKQFLESGALPTLFHTLEPVSTQHSQILQALKNMIIRHLVEDEAVLRDLMKREITAWFAHNNSRTDWTQADHLVSQLRAVALRDPVTFISAVKEECLLTSSESSRLGGGFNLKLRKGLPAKETQPSTSVSTMQVDDPFQADAHLEKPTEENEAVMQFLINEIVAIGRGENKAAIGADNKEKDVDDIEATIDDPHQTRTNALLLVLTELVGSYLNCKTAVLGPARKGNQGLQTGKMRSTLVNVLIHQFIGSIQFDADVCRPEPQTTVADDQRRRTNLFSWSLSAIVALCAEPGPATEGRSTSAEMTAVRKTVLEIIAKSVKDALQPHEPLNRRYGKLWAMSQLCSRLLTSRQSVASKHHDESTLHIAKIMLEKGFVVLLTNALVDIDLNYPSIKNLVTAMLQPLEILTKISTKMGTSEKSRKRTEDESEIETGDSENETETEDEDMEEGMEESAVGPDMYRNSALGMFGGEMDDYMDGEDEGSDDEDEEEHYDEGDDMDEEDSDLTEPSDEEEDEEMEDWDDEEEMDDEDEMINDSEIEEEIEDDDEAPEFMLPGEEDAFPLDAEEEGLMAEFDGDMEDGVINIEDEEGPYDELDEYDDDEDNESELGYEEFEAIDDVAIDQPLSAGSLPPNPTNWGWQPSISPATGQPDAPASSRRTGRGRSLEEEAMFGRSRPNQPSTAAIASHPLLQSEQQRHETAGSHGGNRSRSVRSLGGASSQPGINGIMQSLDRLMGGDALQLLEGLVTRGRGGDTIRIDYDGTAGGQIGIHVGGRSLRMPAGALPHLTHQSGNADGQGSPGRMSLDAMPQPTINRWQEEEKVAANLGSQARLTTITKLIVNSLLPEAKELERKHKEKEEQEEKERMSKVQKEEERKAKEEQVRKEKEEQAARDAAIAEEDESKAEQPSVDVEMAVAPAAEAVLEAQPERARVIIQIHGADVDITETGIDPEFLQALPDEMRADVVAQHLQENRLAAASQSRPDVSSSISPEFLNALPPHIRAEVIQQEALEAARQQSAAAAPAAGTSDAPAQAPPTGLGSEAVAAAAAGVSPASFLSGLGPRLRDVVMMEEDEDFLGALPGHLSTGLLGVRPVGHGRRGQGESMAPTTDTKSAPPAKDAIQLLDKAGIASVVRLLFFPEILRKTHLLRVMGNLAENARSRADLINLLLAVLQDETGDLSLVDKQGPSRYAKPLVAATPKTTPRRKPGPDTPLPSNGIISQMQSESIPTFVAARAFEGLSHITSNNEQATLYFLTEHEVPVANRKPTSKKNKGKDKERPLTQNLYPIVILLSLLDRQSLLSAPSMPESLTALLAALTKPLTQLKEVEEDTKKAEPASEPMQASIDSLLASVPSSSSSPVQPSAQTPVAAPKKVEDKLKVSLSSPPQIPAHILKTVPNILTQGECSSRTFSNTLGLIQHLSHIPRARDIISGELRHQAQSLGDELASHLRQLHQDLVNASEDPSKNNVDVGKFSPASSAQAKLLRILKTIDYTYASRNPKGASNWDAVAVAAIADGSATLTAEEEQVSQIFETFHFAPMWQALSECLTVIGNTTELVSVATVLLPLVESLMVICRYSSAKAAATRKARAGSVPFSPMSPKEVDEDLFVRFTSDHRKLLNVMVRNNPSLMSGSFSLLVLNPRILEFDNKRNWFTQQLRRKPSREAGGVLHLNIRRDMVFEDSYRALQGKTGEMVKYGKLSLKFHNEEGVDAGGVTREWFSILARAIFNPGYCLFEPCAADEGTYQPSQRSWVNAEHLSYFKFVGRIIGKAIYDGRLLDAYFSRSFYKQILGRKVDVRDLESVDPEYHKSLVWMLDNDITDVIDLDFSMEVEEFGAKKVIDLKENGSKIPVTEENKAEYVRLVCEHRLEAGIKEQVNAFLDGFYSIIPRKLISIFDPDQLELLISGISNVDVDELKNATQLHGWKNSDPEITWFWRALRSMSQEEKSRFLMFVTSSSRVPLGGFSQLQGSTGLQPFQIHKLFREDVLPSSATCFNELLLPSFPSYEALRQKLMIAITEGAGHFGHA